MQNRFSDFGHEDFSHGTLVVGAAAIPVTTSTDLQTHEVTARLNWRFNWFGAAPVAARY